MTLSREDEARLCAEGRRGELVVAHLRFAESIARRFARRATFDDFLQEVCEGMLKAAQRFDPSKGFRFTTYAESFAVRQCQRRIHADMHLVRMPESDSARKLIRALRKAPTSTADDLAAIGTTRELAEAVVALWNGGTTEAGDEHGPSRETPEDRLEEAQDRVRMEIEIAVGLAALLPREAEIIRARLDGELPCELDLGVSAQWIGQIERRAMAKMGAAIRRHRLLAQVRARMEAA